MGYNSQQQQQAKTNKKNLLLRQKTALLLYLTARKNVLRADDLANEHTTLLRNSGCVIKLIV